jgi:hypothetical protein
MSTDLFKSEIEHISKEVIRIIDRAHELERQEDEFRDIQWPPYCEPTKPKDKPKGW